MGGGEAGAVMRTALSNRPPTRTATTPAFPRVVMRSKRSATSATRSLTGLCRMAVAVGPHGRGPQEAAARTSTLRAGFGGPVRLARLVRLTPLLR